jgi:hypothetical protein
MKSPTKNGAADRHLRSCWDQSAGFSNVNNRRFPWTRAHRVGIDVALGAVQEAIVNRRISAGIFGVALLFGTVAVPGDAHDVVAIRLYGRYFTEPATVRIMVSVEPDAENRMLRIEADGDSLFRASEVDLNGSEEKPLHTVVFKSLPAGHYSLRAEVRSSRGVRGTAVDNVFVTGADLR